MQKLASFGRSLFTFIGPISECTTKEERWVGIAASLKSNHFKLDQNGGSSRRN